jgi:hypothetical protein
VVRGISGFLQAALRRSSPAVFTVEGWALLHHLSTEVDHSDPARGVEAHGGGIAAAARGLPASAHYTPGPFEVVSGEVRSGSGRPRPIPAKERAPAGTTEQAISTGLTKGRRFPRRCRGSAKGRSRVASGPLTRC